MTRPQQNEYPPYFERYISLVQAGSVAEMISKYNYEQINYIDSLPDDKANFAYADNKWTVKQALQHICDTERIFAFRALCISRGETQTLSAFDQNLYTQNAHVQRRAFEDIKEEFKAVRYATNIMLRSFSEAQLLNTGSVADYSASAKAFVFNIYGHAIHHLQIFKSHYHL